jgi:arabinofuranosyltransferase
MNTLAIARTLPSRFPWLPAAIGVFVLAVDVALFHRFTVDDAYITLRYSRNVASGVGAVYNAVGPRAEGYTSYLWMALLAVPHLLHANALLVAKALGVVFTFASVALVAAWTFTEARGERTRVASVAAAVLAYCALARTAIHAVSGMETAFYTALLTGMLFTASRLARDGVRWAAPFAVLGLAASLTRPEACVAAGVASLVALRMMARDGRWRSAVVIACGFVVPLCAYEWIRVRYYGLPLPLPFYVKVASPGTLPGLEPVGAWLFGELRFVVPLVFVLRSPPRHLQPVLASMAALIVFFLLPQHLMGYSSRYLSPLDPTVSVLFGLGMGRLLRPDDAALRSTTDARARRARLAAASLALPLLLLPVEAWGEMKDRVAYYANGLAAAHERLGRELDALHLRDGRLAISDAGAVPYLSGWWTLDLVGLNDPHIAVTGSRDPAWVLAHSPSLLVLVSTRAERFTPDDWNAFEAPLFDAATAAGYTRVGVRRFASDYWLWILARPGDASAARLSLNEKSETENGGSRRQ